MASVRSFARRGMKAPERTVLLSLVAVLIVCAAPVFVSYMDSQITEGVYTEYEKEGVSLVPTLYNNGSTISYANWSGIAYGELDGTSFILDDSVDGVKMFSVSFFDEDSNNSIKSMVQDGVTRFVFSTESIDDIASVRLYYGTNIFFIFESHVINEGTDEEAVDYYYIDLDTVQKQRILSGSNLIIVCNLTAPGYLNSGDSFEFSVDAYVPDADYSGSTIVGFFGICLIVLAICCTSFVNPLRRLK